MILNIDSIKSEIGNITKEIRYKNARVWLILFASSFLIIAWSKWILNFNAHSVIMFFPIFLNSIAWILWFMYQYIDLITYNRRNLGDKKKEFESTLYNLGEEKILYKTWESQNFKLRKLNRYGKIVELLIAFQLGVIPFAFFYLVLLRY